MSPADNHLMSIFSGALEYELESERAAFVDRACGSNPALRSRVEALLRAHQGAGRFMESKAEEAFTVTPVEAATITEIPIGKEPGVIVAGRYLLLDVIGEGGMGTVWLAEQMEPVRRRVALKLIKPGMDSREVVGRFEAERQALALMDHPNIAKVHDGGVADGGRPFFVMELVRGVPVTEYCDRARLGIRERLAIFIQTCQALQHAHQKGIIHRDLKPSNILVTEHEPGGAGVVKVIDFGVAKAIGPNLTDDPVHTRFMQMVGTPLYMSPEQAERRELDVDTRADIYSLGVVLYELLTGTTPFDKDRFKEVGYDEVRRIIREEEPPKPSARLSTLDATTSTLSADRGADRRRLSRVCRGELDWIVMKSLEKDRDRRYETASAFAADVQRYLADEPVAAGPPSTSYRLRKLLRRNKGAALAISLVVLSLVGGIIGTTVGLLEARQQEKAARKSAEDEKLARDSAVESDADASAFANFLANHVLAASRPEGTQHGLGRNVTMEEALTKAEPKIADVFAGRPRAEALARYEIGVTWRNLGRYAKAEEHLRRALVLYQRELGPENLATLSTRKSLAVTLLQAGHTDEAVKILEEIAQVFTTTQGPDSPYTLNTLTSLARGYEEIGQPEKGLQLLESNLPKSKVNPGPDNPDTLTLMTNLALAYQNAGRQETAVAMMQEVFDKQKAIAGADSPGALLTLTKLAGFYASEGQNAKAIALYEPTLAKLKENLGADHPETLQALGELGLAYLQAGEADRALKLLQEVFAKLEARLGADHPFTLKTGNDVGVALIEAGQPKKGLAMLEQVLTKRTARLGADHPDTLRTVNFVAERYRMDGQPQRAVPLLEQAHAKQQSRFSPDYPDALVTMRCLASAYLESNQLQKALPLFEKTLEMQKVRFGPNHPQTLTTTNNLAVAYQRAGRIPEAVPLLEHVLEQNTRRAGPDHPQTLAGLANLAGAHWALGNRDRGLALREQSVKGHRTRFGDKHPLTLLSIHMLGVAYAELGRFEKALPLVEEAVATHKKEVGADHPQTLIFMMSLAGVLGDAGQYDKAALVGRELLDRRRLMDGPESLPVADVLALLGRNLVRQEKYVEAEATLGECLKIRGQKIPDNWRTFMTRLMLGTALLAQQKDKEAEPLLEQGYKGLQQREVQIPPLGKRNVRESVELVAKLYAEKGNTEKASAWRAKLAGDNKDEQPKEKPTNR